MAKLVNAPCLANWGDIGSNPTRTTLVFFSTFFPIQFVHAFVLMLKYYACLTYHFGWLSEKQQHSCWRYSCGVKIPSEHCKILVQVFGSFLTKLLAEYLVKFQQTSHPLSSKSIGNFVWKSNRAKTECTEKSYRGVSGEMFEKKTHEKWQRFLEKYLITSGEIRAEFLVVFFK